MKYIYALVDPRTKEVRYIGQTVNLDQRYDSHTNKQEDTLKGVWIQELKEAGVDPEWVLLDKCENPRANYLENWWITLGRKQGWNLENSTYPDAKKLGTSFDDMFSNQLLSMYMINIESQDRIAERTIQEQLDLSRAKISVFIMGICALVIFSSSLIVRNFSPMVILSPLMAFTLGAQFVKIWLNNRGKKAKASQQSLLLESAFCGVLIAFVVIAAFSLIEIGKFMK